MLFFFAFFFLGALVSRGWYVRGDSVRLNTPIAPFLQNTIVFAVSGIRV